MRMRWFVGAFYAGLVAFAGWAGGPRAGASVLFGVVAVMVMLRPAEAGRAITDWAGWVFRRHQVETSS